jgi:hypothetical protein
MVLWSLVLFCLLRCPLRSDLPHGLLCRRLRGGAADGGDGPRSNRSRGAVLRHHLLSAGRSGGCKTDARGLPLRAMPTFATSGLNVRRWPNPVWLPLERSTVRKDRGSGVAPTRPPGSG